MSGARLIRLVETGQVIDGIELVKPQEVQPLSEDIVRQLADKILHYQPETYEASGVFDLVRAIERAHGIGRRLDA